VSVGVSVFTLVTISLERYFAICRPLTSLRWQTRRHAYKTICLVWFVALVIMIPTAVCHKLLPMTNGAHKCVEIWNYSNLEKVTSQLIQTPLRCTLWRRFLAFGTFCSTVY
jgi:cholecystokinin A receptor